MAIVTGGQKINLQASERDVLDLMSESSGDLTITGDLIVSGGTSSTTNMVVQDKLIELGNGVTGTPSGDAGIIVERGSSTNAAIIWDESRDEFVLGTTSATGASTGNLTVTPGNVSVERIGAGTEQAEAEVHAKRDVSSGGTYSSTAGIISEDDTRPAIQLVGSANNIGMVQFGDNAAEASGQVYYDHSTDKLRIDCGGNGDRLTLDSSGNVVAEGSVLLKEKADAIADVAAYGQLWVNTATPNELYFTTDAGDDIQITSGTSTATTGDITGVTAGVGLSGGGTSGAVTVTLDLSELSAVTPTTTDSFATLDSNGSTEQRTTITALSNFQAGTAASTGLSASSGVLSVSDLHPVGVSGSANQLLTDDGDGTVTSESNLSFDGSVLEVTGDIEANSVICDGLNTKAEAKTASYECTATDYCILASRSITITLPENADAGRIYVVKRVDDGTSNGTITVERKTSDTIDGEADYELEANYMVATFISDGANWHVIGAYETPE